MFSSAVDYKEALEYAKFRRSQSPVLYNEFRIFEGPFPDLEPRENEEIDPLIIKEEEIVIALNRDDRNEMNGLLEDATDVDLIQPNENENDVTEPPAGSGNENENPRREIITSPNAIDNNGTETSERENSVDLTNEIETASSENVGVEINSSTVHGSVALEPLCANENVVRNDVILTAVDEIPEIPVENGNAVRNSLAAAGTALPEINLETVDEIEFFGPVLEMPKPMGSLRNGMVKFEDDDISGNLSYKVTVRLISSF